MLLKHFFLDKIAHSSYILAGSKSCAVIDPRRDSEIYISEARQMGVRITHILETHLHADFVSGHMDLALKTGAKIYAPKSGKCRFEHVALSEGDGFNIEDMKLDVLETPGHTPEHIVYVVTDQSRGDSPIGAFVGDTMFVGDVGRPDLFPDIAEDLADKLYHSLHDKLLKLPGYCEIYPAHGAGSLCGRAMGAKYTSTIGYERNYNPSLKIKDKNEFIRSLTSNMPPAPDHFSRCSDINRKGAEMLSRLPGMEELTAPEFKERVLAKDCLVLDTRNYAAFAGFHIRGALHIDIGANFPTFAGWVIPPERDIFIVADSYQDAVNARLWMQRVGIDRTAAYLVGGMQGWINNGYQTARLGLVSAEYLHQIVNIDRNSITLIDVRTPLEYKAGHIDGAVNIPAPDIRFRSKEIKRDKPLYLICGTGIRSSLAASILKQKGFDEVNHVSGGMTGYMAAGY